MKKLLLILAPVFLPVILLAEEKPMLGYEVLSDEFDASIPAGNYVLSGDVFEVPGMKKLKSISVQVGSQKDRFFQAGFELEIPLVQSDVAFRKQGYKVTYFEGYELKDQHRVRVKIFLAKENGKIEIREEKPVIYAYSDRLVNFDLLLKPKGKLLFTYPEPEASRWEMTVEGSMLTDNKGNRFPYLFWEASHQPDFAFEHQEGKLAGKILAREAVLPYLDSVLTYMNFNAREKTDFITYWGPRLAENNYSLVQFVVQDQCQRFGEYEINPQPEHFNRFYIIYSAFDRYPGFLQLLPQELRPFERGGFELFEWGGVCYPAYLNLTIE